MRRSLFAVFVSLALVAGVVAVAAIVVSQPAAARCTSNC